MKEDSCFALVWVSLPRLPLQCFIPEFLESVANKIGRFLCFDKATTTLARPSVARFCVELDLRITPPPFIWVGLFDGLKQPITYEKMPKYCGECHIQGHLVTTCPKGQRETPNIQAFPRSMMNRASPPPVRQNASSPNSHPPPPPNPPSTSAYTSDPSPSLLIDSEVARHHPQHTPSHLPSYQQVQPSVSLLQRPPDAATAQPAAALLQILPQAQPTAALLQQAPAAAGPAVQAQPTALLQQAPAAAGPAVQAQPTAPLLQQDPAAGAPSAGFEPQLRTASLLQRVSVSAAPPPPHNPLSLKGKHKSIKSKPPDVDYSTSLTQQQQAALEQFKSKVLGHSRNRDHQLSSPTSVNHFEVLRYDHSDADDEIASYYSDTDDGCVEPTEMGYQSANGRSSNKHKDFAPSGMRINKRHPNMPLRVKLRSRKNSHPSTP